MCHKKCCPDVTFLEDGFIEIIDDWNTSVHLTVKQSKSLLKKVSALLDVEEDEEKQKPAQDSVTFQMAGGLIKVLKKDLSGFEQDLMEAIEEAEELGGLNAEYAVD